MILSDKNILKMILSDKNIRKKCFFMKEAAEGRRNMNLNIHVNV